MRRLMTLAFGCCVLASPLYAALKPGAAAPAFTTQATLAGKPFTFSLADALKNGPVVLYFYPAAFTKGCTVEAHEFAEARQHSVADGLRRLRRHVARRGPCAARGEDQRAAWRFVGKRDQRGFDRRPLVGHNTPLRTP